VSPDPIPLFHGCEAQLRLTSLSPPYSDASSFGGSVGGHHAFRVVSRDQVPPKAWSGGSDFRKKTCYKPFYTPDHQCRGVTRSPESGSSPAGNFCSLYYCCHRRPCDAYGNCRLLIVSSSCPHVGYSCRYRASNAYRTSLGGGAPRLPTDSHSQRRFYSACVGPSSVLGRTPRPFAIHILLEKGKAPPMMPSMEGPMKTIRVQYAGRSHWLPV
jgi:hypothetical protein